MTVKITPNDKNNPPGKLADAELHFDEGVLAGLKEGDVVPVKVVSIDQSGRIKLSRKAFEMRDYETAKQLANEALVIDPNSRDAIDMLELVRRQVALESKAAAATRAARGPRTVGGAYGGLVPHPFTGITEWDVGRFGVELTYHRAWEAEASGRPLDDLLETALGNLYGRSVGNAHELDAPAGGKIFVLAARQRRLDHCRRLTTCFSLLQRAAVDFNHMYPCEQLCLGRLGGAARGVIGPNAQARAHRGCSRALKRDQRSRGGPARLERLWLLGISVEGSRALGTTHDRNVDLCALATRTAFPKY